MVLAAWFIVLSVESHAVTGCQELVECNHVACTADEQTRPL